MELIERNIDKIPDKSIRDKLSGILNNVRSVFHRYNANVPFFIAGGSVYSTLMKKDHYRDIDVYFYSESDFNIVKDKLDNIVNKTSPYSSVKKEKYDTFNASTYMGFIDEYQLQIIKKDFGPPKHIFERFDLVNSMCALTHNNYFISNSNVSKNIFVNYKSVNSKTIQRYFKYIDEKGAIDKDNRELIILYDYFIENAFKEEFNYYSNRNITLIEGLARTGSREMQYNLNNYIHDRITDTYNNSDRILLFQELMKYNTFYVKDGCDEYTLINIIKRQNSESSMNNIITKEDISRIKNKYPEYFI